MGVVDNLGRASSGGKDSFVKIESRELSLSAAEAVGHLKELLEGVEVSVKQLIEVNMMYLMTNLSIFSFRFMLSCIHLVVVPKCRRSDVYFDFT